MIPETVNGNPVRWFWKLEQPLFPAGYAGGGTLEQTEAFLLSVSDEGSDDERFWVTCLGISGRQMAGDVYYTTEAAKRFPSQEFEIDIGNDGWYRLNRYEDRFELAEIDETRYGEEGYFSEAGQFQYILPKRERFVDESRNLYVFGYAGVDGIEFVLAPSDKSVYAYNPISAEITRLAPDFPSFISGWISGEISV